MLNKPITLSLLLFLLSFLIALVLGSIFENNLGFWTFYLSYSIVVLLLALSIGIIFKVKLNKLNKMKIALYFSILHSGIYLPIGALIAYLYSKDSPISIIITLLIFLFVFFTFGLFLYYGLDLGSKLMFKQSKSKE